ncbi:zinc finger MYND domain-containing protein [Sporobolomyces salmoneus]|uniref:zinc finger MYND domain-containing protein n=1 Tax=Sporobolomyces salmoneus TaxID=183962 RepID=UPI0031789216
MSTTELVNGVRVLYRSTDPSTPLALCRKGESFSLNKLTSSTSTSDSSPVMANVSAMVDEDPFPGFTMDGRQMIWVKNYGENAGLLEELERARFVQSVGRTIKQGFVTFPLCIVLLSEKEMLQTCAKCEKVETFDVAQKEVERERFKRCGKCKRRYYCSSEHQIEDWPQHKLDCKDLSKLDFVSVENRKRRRELELVGGQCGQQVNSNEDGEDGAKIVEI